MPDQESAIVLHPEQSVSRVKDGISIINRLRNEESLIIEGKKVPIMRDGHHFGTIPNTKKPTLLKPGAEALCSAFGLRPDPVVVDKVEIWDDHNPLFHYEVKCTLYHIESGLAIASATGSCNSKEERYAWRWVKDYDVPTHLDLNTLKKRGGQETKFQWQIDKAETSGKYGKPADYWQAFKDAIAAGTAIPGEGETARGKSPNWTIDATEYRIPNEGIFSQVNTVRKMADKRALIAVTLIATGASDLFTQDIEDNPSIVGAADNAGFVPSPESDIVIPSNVISASEREKHHIDEPGGPQNETVIEAPVMVEQGGYVPNVTKLANWYIKYYAKDSTQGEAIKAINTLFGFDVQDEDEWIKRDFQKNADVTAALTAAHTIANPLAENDDEEGDF